MRMDSAELQATLDQLGADYTKRLRLRVDTAAPGEVTLTLPVTPELIHAGGVLCGQAILAAADTAMSSKCATRNMRRHCTSSVRIPTRAGRRGE